MTDRREDEAVRDDVPGVVEVVDAEAAREARLAERLRQMVERRPELARRAYVRAKVEGRQPDFAQRLLTPEQLAGRDRDQEPGDE